MYHCFFEGFAFIRSFIAFAGNYIAQVNIADNYFNAVVYRDCWFDYLDYGCWPDLLSHALFR